MDNSIESISSIINTFDTVIRTYEDNIITIKTAEDETQDLLHEVELSNSKDMYGGYLVYKNLKECRERRRQAKNENEQLEEFYQFAKTQTDTKNRLQKIRGHIQTIRTAQHNRVYRPRTRNDLTITPPVNPSPVSKSFENLLSNFKKQDKNKNRNKYA